MPRTCDQNYIADHVRRMHREVGICTRRVELEKRSLAKLDEELRRTRNELDSLKYPRQRPSTAPRKWAQSRATPRPLTARSGPGLRKVVVESRLEASLKQLNRVKHANQMLMKQIDSKRSAQLQLNSVYRKMLDTICTKQREITTLGSSVLEAKEVLENAQKRKSVMKKKIDVERKEFKERLAHLRVELRQRDSEEKEQEIRVQRELKRTIREFLVTDEEEHFSERGLRRKILKTGFLNCIQRRNIQMHVKNIEVFEQAFATIKSTTGISDIEEIVKIFINLEERNFSLLNYANLLYREIENINGCNTELVYHEKTRENRDELYQMRRKGAVGDVAEKLEQIKRVAVEAEDAHSSNNAIVSATIPRMMKMVEAINAIQMFDDSGAMSEPESQLFKTPEGYTEKTVLQWLHWFERVFLLYRDFLPQAKSTSAWEPFPYTVGPFVKENLSPKKVQLYGNTGLVRLAELPSHDDRREDDDEDRVLSLDEVKQRVVGQLTRHPKKKTLCPSIGPVTPDDSPRAGIQQLLAYKEVVLPNVSAQLEVDVSDAEGPVAEDVEPNDEELNRIFLKRYNLSRLELQSMADKMGIQLSNLCYLKQEFDKYDQDQSGYIDIVELSYLLRKLGEDLSEEELEQAFRELDSDHSGEIEFFEFVEWFTTED